MMKFMKGSFLRIAKTSSLTALALVFALQSGVTASAQDSEAPQQEPPSAPLGDDDMATILVLGARVIGQVEAPEPPLLELQPEDIAAYGVSSIGELLDALAPQVGSARGRGSGGGPVVLVNGIRVASFRELRSYPTEAIEKVEVLSEEVAQRYGYSPNQRVVNFILKDNFQSKGLKLEYAQPFEGGFSEQDYTATYLRIDGRARLNLNLELENASPLTEADRGIIQSPASLPPAGIEVDPGEFRSLRADTAGIEATANWASPLGSSGSSLSLNATFEREDSFRLQGLDPVLLNADEPQLRQLSVDRRQDKYSTAASLNTSAGDWRLTATADASRTDTSSAITRRADALDLLADPGIEFADTVSDRASTKLTARGAIAELPAGEIRLTLDSGFDWTRITSSDTRSDFGEIQLTRGDLEAGANLSVPLTERGAFGGALGDLTLTANAGINHLSDFGTLNDWSAGLIWGVTNALTLKANYINSETAPGLSQLGDPEIATPNVQIFDFTNGETVLATLITGGNPDLPAQRQSDWKFSAIWELPFIKNSNINVDYIVNHSQNIATSLPPITQAIEAAFPDRVVRDETGRLLSVDTRPVSFAEQDTERLQIGLNLSGRIGEGSGGRFSAIYGEGRSGGPRGGGRGGDRDDGARGGLPRDAGAGGGDEPRGRFGGISGAPRNVGGAPQGERDPERFARMRAMFCDADPEKLLSRLNQAMEAIGRGEEPPPGENGEPPLEVSPRLIERLRGEDGTIDPQRFARIRERICNADPAQFTQRQRGEQPGRDAAGEGRRRQDGEESSAGNGGRSGAGGGRGRGRLGGGDSGPGGRWFVNLTYTRELDNRILIAPGVPVLDLLGGAATDSDGQPVDVIEGRGGVFYDGYGLSLSGRYRSPSVITAGDLPGDSDLFFSGHTRINLRLFANLGRRKKLVAASPVFKDLRVSFDIDNVFDARQSVVDGTGATPLRYQPYLVDPVGRRFEIELRKLF